MKYFVNGNSGMKSDGLMRLPLAFSMLLIVLFWMVNFMLFYSKMGFLPETIANYYLGNETVYQPARSYISMLEISHGHLAMFALLLLVITHLVIFTDFSKKVKVTVIGGTYLSAISTEASSWLIRFFGAEYSWMKLFSFFALQGFILISLIGLGIYIGRLKKNGN